MATTWKPLATFPCAVSNCPALVMELGAKCSVHRLWSNGPHTSDCYKCRQPIVFGDLWRLIDDDPLQPAHSQCCPRGQRKRLAKQPTLFE